MNIATRRITTALASSGLLIGVGIVTAEAASAYTGSLTFGTVTVSRTCDPSTSLPTSVTYTVSYNATQLKQNQVTTVYAQFATDDGDPDTDTPPSVVINGTSVQATISAHTSGTISATIPVPTAPSDATHLPDVEMGLGTADDPSGPLEDFSLACSAPTPVQFTAPTVASISNPCLGTTTVRLTNSGTSEWLAIPFMLGPGGPGSPADLQPGTTRVVTIGSALRGAESFVLFGGSPLDDSTTDSVFSPILTYDAPCKPGKPATTLTAVRKGARNVLTASIRPGFGGAPVKFYRLAKGRRVLVGSVKTGPAGKAVLRAPRRANTKYVAVVGATHYSVATTTVTRLVR